MSTQLNQVCRTCLAPDGLVRMDATVCKETNKAMGKMLKEFHHSEIINLYPGHFICQSCIIALPHAYKFSKHLEEANGYFRDAIAKMLLIEYPDKTPVYSEKPINFDDLETDQSDFDEFNTSQELDDPIEDIKAEPMDEEQPEKVTSNIKYATKTSRNLISMPNTLTTDCSNGDRKIDVTIKCNDYNKTNEKEELIDFELKTSEIERKTNSNGATKRKLRKKDPSKCGSGARVPCEMCDKTFAFKKYLTAHIRYVHDASTPLHQCTHCGKSFKKKSKLIRHEKSHLNKREYKCDLCYKAFNTFENLSAHIRIHNNERLYKCDICDKRFNVASNLGLHKRRHHSETRPYKCSHCELSYTMNCDLQKHMRTHTGEARFKCAICDKTFVHFSSLRDHKRRHANDKRFKCSHCEKGFITSGGLKMHIRSHTDERVYKCDACSKSFRKNYSRKAHMLKIHSIDLFDKRS